MHEPIRRPIPRLLSPRLPIGPRWTRFCRSKFAADLWDAARGIYVTAALLSAVVVFYVGIPAAYALYGRATGTA